jgi:hypothetical protein
MAWWCEIDTCIFHKEQEHGIIFKVLKKKKIQDKTFCSEEQKREKTSTLMPVSGVCNVVE